MTITAPRPAKAAADESDDQASAQPVTRARAVSPPWLTVTVNILLVMGGVAAWLVAYVFGLSALQEHHDQSVMYSHIREQLALGTAPPFGSGSTLQTGDPVALINAPGIGLRRTVVVEGTSSNELSTGPGHLPGTVLPGEAGVSTIMGRASAFGAPFRKLTSLKPGTSFTVTTGQGVFHYKVIDVRGPGDKIPASLAAVASRLTLVTAVNGGWHDLWVPTHAVFVDAALQGKALPVAAGTTPTTADAAMSGDSAALVPLVLWLQGLLLAAFGLVWLRGNWEPWQVWVVGLPVMVALLWGASADFVRLLPNLF